MLNKVILIGNLTRDVELRYTQGGSAIATLGLATNRRWKDKASGGQKEEVTFVDVAVFGRSAENANAYLKKGSKALIEGRLTFSQWTDQSGNKKSKLSVTAESLQFLDSKEQNGDGNYNNQGNNGNNYSQPPAQQQQNSMPSAPPIEDDEIPFN